MGRKVIISPQAIEDLAEIVKYVAQHDPYIAEKLGHELIERVQVLADFPHIGTPYRKRSHVQTLHSPPYLIYYRIKPRSQVVEVLCFWHAARRKPHLR